MKKRVACVALAATVMASCLPVMAADASAETTVYNFGAVDVAGAVTVSADTEYTAKTGYGFFGLNDGYSLDARIDGWTMTQGYDLVLENGADDGASDVSDTWVSTTVDAETGIVSPIRFAVASETNKFYRVKVNMRRADLAKQANVSLFTEKRHQHLLDEPIPEEGLSYECTVHVHNNWSKKTYEYTDTMLNVVAEGENVAITSIEVEPLETGKTLWILGDSTVCEQTASIPYFPLQQCQGVGSAMAKYLPSDWSVVNEAESGLAARDAVNHFNNFIGHVLPGDVVWFEFGHNDSKITGDPATNGYLSSLETYYNAITEKGATLVVVSPIERCLATQYSDGAWSHTLSQYTPAAQSFVDEKIAAGADNIAFIDLNTASLAFLNEVQKEITDAGYDYGSSAPRFYYYVSKAANYQQDYTHPNDYGADNFAAIAVELAKEKTKIAGSYKIEAEQASPAVLVRAEFDENKTLVDAAKEDISLKEGDNYITIGEETNAYVWSGLDTMKPYTLSLPTDAEKTEAASLGTIASSRDVKANRVGEEIYSLGKAPNSMYSESLVEVIKYPYPIILDDITFDENGAPASVSGTWVASELACNYAKVKVDIYDADGELKGTYISDDVFDAVGTTSQVVYFTAGEVVFDADAGDTFNAYAVKYDDEELVLTDTVVSTTLDEDSLIDIKETLIDEDFSGYETTGTILGNNGWTYAGTGEFSLQSDNDDSYYAHYSVSGTSYYPYRAFTAVSSGQLMIKYDLRYTEGYANLHLTNGGMPNRWETNGWIMPVKVATSGNEVKVSLDGTEVCSINKNEWTTIKLIIDMDYGKYYLTVAGQTYEADAAFLQTAGIPAPSKLALLSFTESSKSGSTAYDIANLTVATLNTAALPDYTVALNVNDSAMGSVSGAGTYTMNTTATITATPADGCAFTGWQTADGEVYSEETTISFRVREDMALTAIFIKQSGISSVVDYSITADKNGVKAETGRTVQLSITDAVDDNGNPVSAATASDAVWSSNTAGITVSADGLVTVGADYTIADNSVSTAEIKCVLNGIEKTFTLTTYSYAYYEAMDSASNYNGRIMNYGGRDAIVFGGSKESFVYTLGNVVALDKATTITYKNAWSGSNTCGQYRTLNFRDSSGNTIFSMYYEWNGLVVSGTSLGAAVSKDTWTDVVISVDPTTKVVTVTANGNTATTTLAGSELASIQLSAAQSVPSDRLLGISEIIIKQ